MKNGKSGDSKKTVPWVAPIGRAIEEDADRKRRELEENIRKSEADSKSEQKDKEPPA